MDEDVQVRIVKALDQITPQAFKRKLNFIVDNVYFKIFSLNVGKKMIPFQLYTSDEALKLNTHNFLLGNPAGD